MPETVHVRQREPLWYHEPWPVVLALLFCPPLGIVMLWVSRRMGLGLKIGLSLVIVLLAIAGTAFDAYTGHLSEGLLSFGAFTFAQAGEGRYEDGDYRDALRCYSASFRLHPLRRATALRMGLCYEKLGQPGWAELYYWVAYRERRKTMEDAVARLIPGVLGCAGSLSEESFSGEGLLEYPQYTRPAEYRGLSVPEVLLSGHHEKIREWRLDMARRITRERRMKERSDEAT